MASEWVMYIAVIAIGVLTIAGVTLTFNAININTLEDTVEIGLNEVVNTVAKEVKNILEIGLDTDPLTRVSITKSLNIPNAISGHQFQITFRVFPGANHWFIEASDITDPELTDILYETTLPWTNVTLSNLAGNGIPVIYSYNTEHFITFLRSEGTDIFKIIIA
ncbi:MAG: hypothetical protein FK734_02535 [Asgard group archaeon]|nr:hypothetical protein [Asgard group archaeon]